MRSSALVMLCVMYAARAEELPLPDYCAGVRCRPGMKCIRYCSPDQERRTGCYYAFTAKCVEDNTASLLPSPPGTGVREIPCPGTLQCGVSKVCIEGYKGELMCTHRLQMLNQDGPCGSLVCAVDEQCYFDITDSNASFCKKKMIVPTPPTPAPTPVVSQDGCEDAKMLDGSEWQDPWWGVYGYNCTKFEELGKAFCEKEGNHTEDRYGASKYKDGAVSANQACCFCKGETKKVAKGGCDKEADEHFKATFGPFEFTCRDIKTEDDVEYFCKRGRSGVPGFLHDKRSTMGEACCACK